MLEVEGLEAAYGTSQVLFGIDLRVGEGEVVAMLGRNGMGKTTTIRAIAGLTRPSAGRIRLEGSDIAGLRPHVIARAGIGLVPEGRQIFPNLNVEENLVATMRVSAGHGWSLGAIHDRFPVLAERARAMGHQLSGGEQQMLAIGRALLTDPRLLLLDEATEGLAPKIRAEIWRTIGGLKTAGLGILVVDRDLAAIARYADRAIVLEKGAVAWEGSASDLADDRAAVERLLTV